MTGTTASIRCFRDTYSIPCHEHVTDRHEQSHNRYSRKGSLENSFQCAGCEFNSSYPHSFFPQTFSGKNATAQQKKKKNDCENRKEYSLNMYTVVNNNIHQREGLLLPPPRDTTRREPRLNTASFGPKVPVDGPRDKPSAKKRQRILPSATYTNFGERETRFKCTPHRAITPYRATGHQLIAQSQWLFYPVSGKIAAGLVSTQRDQFRKIRVTVKTKHLSTLST